MGPGHLVIDSSTLAYLPKSTRRRAVTGPAFIFISIAFICANHRATRTVVPVNPAVTPSSTYTTQ